MRRPFHLVGVTHGRRRVEVSFDCPPQHELARLLCDLSKIDERIVGGFQPGFFSELTPSHRDELLARLYLALGDRPMADVLRHPERSALMCQEHLQATVPAAPKQDPGTPAPRFVRRHHLPPRPGHPGPTYLLRPARVGEDVLRLSSASSWRTPGARARSSDAAAPAASGSLLLGVILVASVLFRSLL